MMRTLLAMALAFSINDVSDLPLTEVPATGTSQQLALFLTGDGGWAGLDKGVSARFAERGIATIGFDSRSYFWRKRTPEQAARDIERVLRHYLSAWNKTQAMLVGYSFGGEVLPFIVNRLPQDLRNRIVTVTLLGPEPGTSFEVHLMDWLPGVGAGGMPVQPEIQALGNIPVLCIYGEGEAGALCPQLPSTLATVQRIGGGHHFGRDYTALADRILAFAADMH
jgi:Type IV secretory pathway, VirJ component